LNRKIYFHEAAVEEADVAFTWYYVRSPKAAQGFLEEMARILEEMSHSPQLSVPYQSGTKRAIFRRYPYSIIFIPRSERIDVLAIAHAKRRPGYWRKRQMP
jgi:toxin ParE1/3/4